MLKEIGDNSHTYKMNYRTLNTIIEWKTSKYNYHIVYSFIIVINQFIITMK